MKRDKIVCTICNILIALLLPSFLFSLCWYFSGSLEMVPTAEQEEKAKLSAIILMIITGTTCIACIIIKIWNKAGSKKGRNGFCQKGEEGQE